MPVRKATAADVPKIEACARAAYAMYVDRIGREPAPMVADFARQVADGIVYVVGRGCDVDGYAVFYPKGDHLHLENVAIFPEHKGKGLGRRLIGFVEAEALRQGYSAVQLYTNQKMTENLEMYPKLGYVEQGRWPEEGFDRVFFCKELSRSSS